MQAESSKFALLLFDQSVQIVIPPSVPELIGTQSDNILHQSDCCLLHQLVFRKGCDSTHHY